MINEASLIISYQAPELESFIQLREQLGWKNPERSLLKKSIDNSLFWVILLDQQERLVGTARVIGDGAMYFYIQDVIVAPAFQGKGLGAKLMTEVEQYLETVSAPGVTIGLLAAKGKENFYQKFDYIKRDGENLGLGMCRFI